MVVGATLVAAAEVATTDAGAMAAEAAATAAAAAVAAAEAIGAGLTACRPGALMVMAISPARGSHYFGKRTASN